MWAYSSGRWSELRLSVLGCNCILQRHPMSNAGDVYWRTLRTPIRQCGDDRGEIKPLNTVAAHVWCEITTLRPPMDVTD